MPFILLATANKKCMKHFIFSTTVHVHGADKSFHMHAHQSYSITHNYLLFIQVSYNSYKQYIDNISMLTAIYLNLMLMSYLQNGIIQFPALLSKNITFKFKTIFFCIFFDSQSGSLNLKSQMQPYAIYLNLFVIIIHCKL